MESEAPGTEPDAPPDPAELLAGLLGTTAEEMREHPEVVKAKLAAVFGELSQLKSAGGKGVPRLDATRELMSRIRRGLQSSGEPVPDQLDELPERLAELSGRLGETTPEDLAGFLRGLAGLVSDEPTRSGEQGAQLEAVVAWLEQNVGPLVGLERRREQDDARLQAEYREAAKRSIDAALRSRGITPLTTDPEPNATQAARPAASTMNRHRLFWKEFAASSAEIRATLLRGEAEAARLRVEELLSSYDLDLPFELSLEGAEAVLTFPPQDAAEAALRLQLVIRDSPALEGWRIVRGRRFGAGRAPKGQDS